MSAEWKATAISVFVPAVLPVTVKHRAGWDDLHKNAPEFACAMVEAGAQMITVHGRTRTQGFAGSSDRGIIRTVRDVVPPAVPVVGNGDVVTVEDFRRMRDETGCDAVMIGRGAMGTVFKARQPIGFTWAGMPDAGIVHRILWLEGLEPGSLDGLQYAVLGVGDRNWAATYQRVPTLIDERMAAAGAVPVLRPYRSALRDAWNPSRLRIRRRRPKGSASSATSIGWAASMALI